MQGSVYDILSQEAEMLREDLIQAIIDNGQKATGRTISQIASDSGNNFIEITGPGHIATLQYGRGPTSAGGDGKLYDKILEWVKAKGVVFQDGIRNSKYTAEERTAKFLTYYIHKNGTYLYRNKQTFSGETDPILRVFNEERIQAIADKVTELTMINVSSEIFKELNRQI